MGQSSSEVKEHVMVMVSCLSLSP